MGRKRKDGNPLGLEKRVEFHHGQFRYLHRDGRKEPLGSDIRRANERAKLYNDPAGLYGTLGYFIDLHIADAEAGRLLRPKRARTIADNKIEARYLKAAFGKLSPLQLVHEPSLIAEYRDNRSDEKGRGRIRANREMSLLSAVYAWLIDRGHCPGLNVNPVKLIARNVQKPKERYVEDAEYQAVYGIALRSVCMAMLLSYRTLQRPSDLLALGPANIRTKTVAGKATRVLSLKQGKTGKHVDIEVTDDIHEALHMLTEDGELASMPMTLDGKVRKPVNHLIHTAAGKAYTLAGIGAMLRRSCVEARVKTFGLMDIRAKGATDMYLAGTPLEKIQLLMGHESVMTTEIYIKRLMGTITVAQPNPLRISGG